ncbi:tubulin family [Plasmopara halstedii]|uniref:Tubulin delta chain n=1 Tax=Plasmopara halstedii TaxID=4781 RepID=A0A0P1APE4_PLAHL|nr:tubulin family [Plasmopara halstedii]CEG42952.1 tubulin family [Plasmopara halstedii]|eukprot:XP_024579321.1 tubulin family [Plasmopara halstedii]
MLALQVGQCGNQLGRALFDKIAKEENVNSSADSLFFRSSEYMCSDRSIAVSPGERRARAILIDMEPKVIQECYHSEKISKAGVVWSYDPKNLFTRQSGSGNNWASGFHTQSTESESELLNLVQSEIERCDLFKGFITLQSAAGGTGSGLGSFLTEKLADYYPSTSLLNAVVWPCCSGEVIVQNYNAVLSLASLAKVAHGIFIMQNEAAKLICQKALHISNPSFDAINEVLATHMASSFLSVDTVTSHRSGRMLEPLTEIRERLCQNPAFKLLDIKMLPLMSDHSKEFSTHTWTGIVKYLRQMHITNAAFEEQILWDNSLNNVHERAFSRSVGSILVLRGEGSHLANASSLSDPRMYAPWNADPFRCYFSSANFNAYDKTGTLISNSKAILQNLSIVMDKAYDMFSHDHERLFLAVIYTDTPAKVRTLSFYGCRRKQQVQC